MACSNRTEGRTWEGLDVVDPLRYLFRTLRPRVDVNSGVFKEKLDSAYVAILDCNKQWTRTPCIHVQLRLRKKEFDIVERGIVMRTSSS
jgi:hypothetical protein